MKNRKMLRVTGTGRKKVRPDWVRIAMTLQGVCRTYGESMERSAEETEKLKRMFSAYGPGTGDLKTLEFRVDPEYEPYEEGNVYRQRLAGYRYCHRMEVQIPSEMDRLGRILGDLACGTIRPELDLAPALSDPEAVKKDLMALAVRDAREKAETLASAAGLQLGELLSVEYPAGDPGGGDGPVPRILMADMAKGEAIPLDPGYEPEAFELADCVTMVWAIG